MTAMRSLSPRRNPAPRPVAARLKIGLLTDNYPHSGGFGGIGSYTRAVAEELVRLGHEAHVFTSADVPKLRRREIDGVQVWDCPGWSKRREMPPLNALEFTLRYRNDAMYLYRYALLNGVRAAARGGKFDVIESPEYGALGDLVCDGGHAKRFAVRLHGPPAQADWPDVLRAEKALALSGDVLTSPTEYSRVACEETWGVSVQAEVIGNPVDAHEVDPAAFDPAVPRSGGLYFGRLQDRKGVDVLARALGPIRERFPNFRQTFTGKNVKWPDGRTGDQVIREAAAEGGSGPEAFALQCDPPMSDQELRAAVGSAALCILPSRLETFGIVVVEAMTWGTPLVASDIAPFRELGTDGEHFLLFKSGDSGDLADKVCKLLADPDLGRRLARAAAGHARQWSVEVVVPKLLEVWLDG